MITENFNIIEHFNATPWSYRLGKRKRSFEIMLEHLYNYAKFRPVTYIVETGCARAKDAWESDGQSTLIWDWVCDIFREQRINVKCISLELDPECLNESKSQTKNVQYKLGDSVNSLNTLAGVAIENIGLLYLDSYDWTKEKNLESSLHHLMELAACWRFLPRGCLICVDDRHDDIHGKHILVESFLEHLGLDPLFAAYQIGWIKP